MESGASFIIKRIKTAGTYDAILKKHGILEKTNDPAVPKQKSTE